MLNTSYENLGLTTTWILQSLKCAATLSFSMIWQIGLGLYTARDYHQKGLEKVLQKVSAMDNLMSNSICDTREAPGQHSSSTGRLWRQVRQHGQDSRRPAWFDTLAGSTSRFNRQVLQLPHSCATAYLEVPDSRSHEDDRFRSSDFSTRLLQLFAVQHIEIQHQQVAAYPEQSSKSRHTICMEERCPTPTQSAALAFDRRQDQIQDCRHHTQSSFVYQASLFERPSEGTRHGRDPPASFQRSISPGATICSVVRRQGKFQLRRPFGLEQFEQTMQSLWLCFQFQKTSQDWTVRCACVSLGDHPSPWCIRVAPLRSFAC